MLNWNARDCCCIFSLSRSLLQIIQSVMMTRSSDPLMTRQFWKRPAKNPSRCISYLWMEREGEMIFLFQQNLNQVNFNVFIIVAVMLLYGHFKWTRYHIRLVVYRKMKLCVSNPYKICFKKHVGKLYWNYMKRRWPNRPDGTKVVIQGST